MAIVRDLLYLLAESAMAEDEIVAELRTDVTVIRACLDKLGGLEVVHGPTGDQRMWTAVPEDAAFDMVIAKAKAVDVDVRAPLASFAADARSPTSR